MKHSLILYGSNTPLHVGHQIVKQDALGGTFVYFVRMEVFEGGIDEALAAANPTPGETVLNTVSVNPITSKLF